MATAAIGGGRRAPLASRTTGGGGGLRGPRRWPLILSYFFLALFCAFFLAPPVYMLITSLKTSGEIAAQAGSPWLVRDPTLANYAGLLTMRSFLIFFKNSVLVSAIVVAVTMVVSVLAAFALARMRFLGSTILATGVFLTYLIPDTLLFIPMFKIFSFLRDV